MRVTVDIVPFGMEDRSYTIETYEIGNIGHLDHMNRTLCRYAIYKGSRFTDENTTELRPADAHVWHERSDGAAVLVERVLARLRTGKEGASGLPGWNVGDGGVGGPAGPTDVAGGESS